MFAFVQFSTIKKVNMNFKLVPIRDLPGTQRMGCPVALVWCEVSSQLAFYRMNEPCLKETESPQAPSVFIPYLSNMIHPTPLNYQLDQLLWWKPPTWYFLALAVWQWCHQCLIPSATLTLRSRHSSYVGGGVSHKLPGGFNELTLEEDLSP